MEEFMSYQDSIHVNLQDAKLIEFVVKNNKKQGFQVTPTSPSGFSIKAQRTVGKSKSSVFWSKFIDCAIFTGYARPVVIARQEIICLAHKPVIIELTAHLQIDDRTTNASQAEIITNSFKIFDAAIHGDPYDYISDSLGNNNTITRKMFRVDLGYTILIDGDTILEDLPLQRFLDFWKGNLPGQVVGTRPTPGRPAEFNSIAEAIHENDMWAGVLGDRDVYAVVPVVPDPNKIDAPDAQKIAEDRARTELDRADCNRTRTETHEIAQLLSWFETKWELKEVRIDLGCGNWMSLYVPSFQSREVGYYLYAAVTIPDVMDEDVTRAVMRCFWSAVLAGTVVLVALSDTNAARIAFKALFLECIVSKFEQALSCTMVDLFIQRRVINDWH
jgi:hypothetical protein